MSDLVISYLILMAVQAKYYMLHMVRSYSPPRSTIYLTQGAATKVKTDEAW